MVVVVVDALPPDEVDASPPDESVDALLPEVVDDASLGLGVMTSTLCVTGTNFDAESFALEERPTVVFDVEEAATRVAAVETRPALCVECVRESRGDVDEATLRISAALGVRGAT